MKRETHPDVLLGLEISGHVGRIMSQAEPRDLRGCEGPGRLVDGVALPERGTPGDHLHDVRWKERPPALLLHLLRGDRTPLRGDDAGALAARKDSKQD